MQEKQSLGQSLDENLSDQKLSGRQFKKKQTHGAVLAAARETFRNRGFQATTIREISGLAKVATGTVMAHFSSKEELLYSVLHDDINKISSSVLSRLDTTQSLADMLHHIAAGFLRGYSTEPDLYSTFLEHSIFARGEWGDRFQRQVEDVGVRVGQLFVEAIERGELSETTNIQAATMSFFANYYFVLIQQIKSRFSDVDAGITLMKSLVDHQIKGLWK